MNKIWFITGASRGLGRALAQEVLQAGHKVIATARKAADLADLVEKFANQVKTVSLDVKSAADAQRAIAEGVAAFGTIDVVVNNAGYGFQGAFEEQTPEDFQGQIDTNFWGVVNITRAVLPILRQQRSGHIIQITSIGGRGAFPGFSGYHAAKFAVEGLSESLAQEVAAFGIKVTIVEPGSFRTDWAGQSMAYAREIPGYDVIRKMRELLQSRNGNQPGDPRKAAQVLLKLIDLPEAPLRLPLGHDAMAVLRSVYKKNADELEKWAELTAATDFDGLKVSNTDHAILQALRK
ncbi:MAG TPA: oxidoreductase [Verrucomicrobiae bacterium]|jgi:NAD(P)-dependent dehydrogenase (short-subunit alcohol dehydrogenase family)